MTRSRVLGLLFIAIIVIAVPLTVFILKQQQDVRQRASEDVVAPNVVASVGGEKITKEAVEELAKIQYSDQTINKQALERSLDVLIERKILDSEGKRLRVSLTSAGVPDSEEATVSALLADTRKYTHLREKIIQSAVESREAYVIGFWIPPLTYPQKPEYAAMRAKGQVLLSQIEQRLKNNEIPYEIAKDVYDQNPEFQLLLGVNGYRLNTSSDSAVFSSPKYYTFTDDNKSQPLYKALFSMKANEIKQVQGNDGSGGYVVAMKKVIHAGEDSYNDWLEQKKSELVKMYNPL